MMLSRTAGLWAILLLCPVLSCAPVKALIDRTALEKIVWPGPPEKPRISYLWSVSSWGSEQSGIAEFFAGASDFDPADPRSAERLIRPYGVFVDEADYLYITDPGAYRVTIIGTREGDVRHILSAGSEDFLSPISVVAYRGKILVSDSLLKKVFIFDASGKLESTFEGVFERPTGLGLDAVRGIVYVADTTAHTVYLHDSSGRRLGSIGGHGTDKGEFNFPTHLWVDKRGDLYVVDSMNFRIQIFSGGKTFAAAFGTVGDAYGNLEKPKGIAVDSQDNTYVVDSIRDMVKIFDREGRLLLFFGGQGHDYGQFWLPSGIFIRNDVIYISDTYNGRIQAFRYLGARP